MANGIPRADAPTPGISAEPARSMSVHDEAAHAGIAAAKAVIASASKRDPVVTLAMLLGTFIIAGVGIWMVREVSAQTNRVIAAMAERPTREEVNSTVGKGLAPMEKAIDRNTAAIQSMNARIDRLLDRK